MLWTFCESPDLGVWEREALDRLSPFLAAIDGLREGDGDRLSELPPPIPRMLYDAIEEVARGNLYSAVVGSSEATPGGTILVVEAAERVRATIPVARTIPSVLFPRGPWLG